ncbi:hypothetical protein ANCCEY_08009 [Ancylostoma ceylanicum]|uniref:WD domain, G-beta repeat protein n=1 Tax=Ancylostoma ceylanicum TaxID=53326 RepID=A0A0D6LZ57_9BILA|nr:hypothetical protein ANCCEY_08009 [Ancylostoma ceylanicum]
MSKEKHRSRSKDKHTGIPLPKAKAPKTEPRSHVSDTDKKERSRSRSKTSESKTTASSESKKHKEKKSKSSVDDVVSTKHHKSTKSHSSEAEKHGRKSKKEEKKVDEPVPVTRIEPEQPVDDEYSYDFDYEDDFESDDEADDSRSTNVGTKKVEENGIASPASSVLDQPAISKRELLPPSSPAAERTESGGSSRRGSSNNSREDIVEETPLLRRLATRQGGRPPDPAPPPKVETKQQFRIASAERRINFSNASVVNQSAIAQADERYRKLRELIVLEPVLYTIVDCPPIKDYDFYMELFGQSGKNQSSTQTGDDDLSEETQTEDNIEETKWTQHPAHDDFGWGAESSSTMDLNTREDQEMAMFRENHLENPRLKQFMESAGQVIIDLISARHKSSSDVVLRNKCALAFSSGFNSFELGPIAQSSRVVSVALNSKAPELLLVSFFVRESPAEDIVSRTLSVEFYLEEEQPPKRLFLSEGEVTCTCYTPDGTALIAGVNDSSVEAYDLLEPSSAFTSAMPWIGFINGKDYHVFSSSCQVASLDQSGSITLWAMLRDSYGRPGVRPESQLSLQLLALIRPDPFLLRASSQPTPLLANCMVSRADPQMFLVGTDAGFLCNLSRTKVSSQRGPRLMDSKINVFGEVLCAKASPFESSIILVGFSSGCLALYRLGQLNPATVLTPPSSSRKPVSSVEWSPIRLLVWDLSMGRTPLAVNDLSQQALGLSSGKVEVHALETARAKKEGNLLSTLKALDE